MFDFLANEIVDMNERNLSECDSENNDSNAHKMGYFVIFIAGKRKEENQIAGFESFEDNFC